MSLILPYWFPQRQGKAEPVEADLVRLTAPNLPEAYIAIRKADNGLWSAGLRLGKDATEVSTTGPDWPTDTDAWEAAFELYRKAVVN